jgi:hypothetical protein
MGKSSGFRTGLGIAGGLFTGCLILLITGIAVSITTFNGCAKKADALHQKMEKQRQNEQLQSQQPAQPKSK